MFLCTTFKFHLGCREVWKCHFLFFENGSFCNTCVGKVAECFWGHIVTLCRPRHLIQCKFAHFILPRSSHFVDTSQKLWGSWNISLPKSCQSKFSNLCIDHYWPCAMIIRPERQRHILQQCTANMVITMTSTRMSIQGIWATTISKCLVSAGAKNYCSLCHSWFYCTTAGLSHT